MNQKRYMSLVFIVFMIVGLAGAAPAQTQPPAEQAQPHKSACGPDHKILYKRAVGLLDNAEKKLNSQFTAEAKSMVKEAKSLFAILQKECGQDQKERPLNPKEEQQEAINQKLAADENTQAENLMKSAEEKFKKAEKLETSQPDMYKTLMRQAKLENEQAQKRSIKSMIYAMRTDQMLFSWLGK